MSLSYTVAEPYLAGWVDHVAGMPVVKLQSNVEGRGVDMRPVSCRM